MVYAMPHLKRLVRPGVYEPSNDEGKVMDAMKSVVYKRPLRDLTLTGKIGYLMIWVVGFVIPVVMAVALYFWRTGW